MLVEEGEESNRRRTIRIGDEETGPRGCPVHVEQILVADFVFRVIPSYRVPLDEKFFWKRHAKPFSTRRRHKFAVLFQINEHILVVFARSQVEC